MRRRLADYAPGKAADAGATRFRDHAGTIFLELSGFLPDVAAAIEAA
jgi:hypothetical protein